MDLLISEWTEQRTFVSIVTQVGWHGKSHANFRGYSRIISSATIIVNVKSPLVKRHFYNERRYKGFEAAAEGKFYGTGER
jgi:hypothetical protein